MERMQHQSALIVGGGSGIGYAVSNKVENNRQLAVISRRALSVLPMI